MKNTHPNKASDSGSVQDVEKTNKPVTMIEKILSDKDLINKFFNGEITGSQLNENGVKLVKAI